jgi:hypothetical protein
MEKYLKTSTALMLASAVVIGSAISLLASAADLRLNKFASSLFLLCIIFMAWWFVEGGAIRRFAAVRRMVLRPDRSVVFFILKALFIVWLGLGAYANFDIQNIRSSIIFAVLVNILTGALFESSRSVGKIR